MVAKGILAIVVIPSILAFAFGVWVYYNIVIDVSERRSLDDTGGGAAIKCVQGCSNGDILNKPAPAPFAG
jgi:hypothetical protein